MRRPVFMLSAVMLLLLFIAPLRLYSEEENIRRPPMEAVQNLYFTKWNRFEVFPYFAYLPADNFVKLYGAGLSLSYYLPESSPGRFLKRLGGEINIFYTPDLGATNIKTLTFTLMDEYVDYSKNDPAYYMDINRLILFGSAGLIFSPVYGKINLFGERVLNLDFSVTGGLAYILMNEEILKDTNPKDGRYDFEIEREINASKAGFPIGFVLRFFPTKWLTLRADMRYCFYLRKEPDWSILSEGGAPAHNFDPSESEFQVTRIRGMTILALGASFFFP